MIRTKMEGNWSGLDEALVLKFSTFVAPRSTVRPFTVDRGTRGSTSHLVVRKSISELSEKLHYGRHSANYGLPTVGREPTVDTTVSFTVELN